MAIFKCKMCGEPLDLFKAVNGICRCDLCNTTQTISRLSSEKVEDLYGRASHFRRLNEFDLAMSVYEQIITEDPNDPEAYWGVVLCRYGIEYVKDTATGRRIPTVNRTQLVSIFFDDEYKIALDLANPEQRELYKKEAEQIDNIQKGILELSSKEEPFDVFICYKETDENGRRTEDSVLANQLYNELSRDGLKVFFSRITLEDKLGSEYEPYIFSALQSARVMVAFGTQGDYFKAVWVKNEWSRFLNLIKSGKRKFIVPAYKDANDLPDEFKNIQGQDLTKIGAILDLAHGVEKLVGKKKETVVQVQTAPVYQVTPTEQGSTDITGMISRAYDLLNNGKFAPAVDYANKVLEINLESGEAYLIKFLAELGYRGIEDLKKRGKGFKELASYKKVRDYAGAELERQLNEIETIATYNEGINLMKASKFENAINCFNAVISYGDSKEKISECKRCIEIERERQIAQIKRREEQRLIDEKKRIAEEKEHFKQRLRSCKYGDEFTFGTYANERIEWRVISCDRDSVLLLSKYAIDNIQYKESYVDTTWKSSSLRKWLNGGFYEQAFDADEKAMIKVSSVYTPSISSDYPAGVHILSVDGGGTTEDRVFLLCLDEVSKYLKTNEARSCKATDHAKSKGIFEKGGRCYWGLRSPGCEQKFQALIKPSGEIFDSGYPVKDKQGVRQAIRIMIEHKSFELKNESSAGMILGDLVVMGKYENKPIEWTVIAKHDNKALIVSKEIIDIMPYNEEDAKVTWAECSLRRWLNEAFYNSVFEEKEKQLIDTTHITTPDRKIHIFKTVKGGAPTDDKVFLLSPEQVRIHFESNTERAAKLSELAESRGVDAIGWALRAPGKKQNFVAVVERNGYIVENGMVVNSDKLGVRPAMWVKL